VLNELETCSKREIESEGNRERAETQIHTHKVQLGARSQASENQFRPEREKSERSSRSAYIDDGVVVVGGYIHPSPFCVSASVKGSETTRKGGEGPAPDCSPSSFFFLSYFRIDIIRCRDYTLVARNKRRVVH
jgi:hypothetical protein